MKIKPEHYEVLREAITATASHPAAQGCEKRYQELGRTPMRLRWDLLYASKLKIGDGVGMDGLPLYAYMNDDHIDTALRNICKELNLNWAASQ